MKVLYKDHVKWAIRDAKKEALEASREIQTLLLYGYEFDNLVLSYPSLEIHTNPTTGKHSMILDDGIIVVEL